MKWFSHDTNAHTVTLSYAKLLMKYGYEGYGFIGTA